MGFPLSLVLPDDYGDGGRNDGHNRHTDFPGHADFSALFNNSQTKRK